MCNPVTERQTSRKGFAVSEWSEKVKAGYAFGGATLPLGALMEAGEPNKDVQVGLALAMMNRHGLIAGATGTGKTKTLQVMAEELSKAGVNVFAADVKGDLSGVLSAGQDNEKIKARAASLGQDWAAQAAPVEVFSLGGLGKGVPIRATITDFGPILLSKVLELNETQESSLGLIFHYADSKGLELDDVKDLKAVITFLTSDEGKAELTSIGGLSAATAGVILRALVNFEAQGADKFFGLPNFDSKDLLREPVDGRGVISLLELPAVQDKPALFSTFLMWLLADMYQDLPEVGDAEKPKLVFFFDEAHLLFSGASKAFLQQVTQTVRLIRSKGVGIFFVTQTPKDVPADVLGQLGNRVQHALRAFTPEDAKALKATVSTFPNSDYDLEELIPALGIGEAIVVVMSETGAPTPVAHTRLRAPETLMAPAPEAELDAAIAKSPLAAKYGAVEDRPSAFEKLQQKAEAAAAPAEGGAPAGGSTPAPAPAPAPKRQKEEPNMVEQVINNPVVKSFLRSAGTQIARSLFGTRRR
ncbi:DUF853 family protein [Micrococcales bacterium 31B]|nr:DUF853 family protein [Micrococcales bacterium 31B]